MFDRGALIGDASAVGYPERFASMRLECEAWLPGAGLAHAPVALRTHDERFP
jgi:hypothetical protein